MFDPVSSPMMAHAGVDHGPQSLIDRHASHLPELSVGR